jgi:hypothetical protein
MSWPGPIVHDLKLSYTESMVGLWMGQDNEGNFHGVIEQSPGVFLADLSETSTCSREGVIHC